MILDFFLKLLNITEALEHYFEKRSAFIACVIVLALFLAVAAGRMGLIYDVTSESEHINHLEVSILSCDGEGGCIVREIGAMSDAGEFEARRQFIQPVQYHHSDPYLIIPDRVQMRIARVDLW